MHSQTALRSQLDKGWKNNSQFASPSIRRPTHYRFDFRNVAVIGSQSRIGTTTAAMGLSAWLARVGASVCYVEAHAGTHLASGPWV